MNAIRNLIKNPPENSRVFTISPLMAKEIVRDYNRDNRPKKPGKISEYGADMANAKWRLTGDTIKFSTAHLLRDGQNRMLAAIKANASFRTHIVFGIDDAHFDSMDRGKNRTGGDLLAIHGIANGVETAAAVRWAELLTNGNPKARTTFTQRDILELYKTKHSGVTAFINDAQRIKKAALQPAGQMAALLYCMSKVDHHDAVDFAAAWENGQRAGRYLPIKKAEQRISQIGVDSFGRVNDVVRAALIVIAWNLFRAKRKGEKVNFMWSLADTFPAIQ